MTPQSDENDTPQPVAWTSESGIHNMARHRKEGHSHWSLQVRIDALDDYNTVPLYMAADHAAVTRERDALRVQNERLWEFVRAYDVVEHLIADHTDDRVLYNSAVDRANVARAALGDTP